MLSSISSSENRLPARGGANYPALGIMIPPAEAAWAEIPVMTALPGQRHPGSLRLAVFRQLRSAPMPHVAVKRDRTLSRCDTPGKSKSTGVSQQPRPHMSERSSTRPLTSFPWPFRFMSATCMDCQSQSARRPILFGLLLCPRRGLFFFSLFFLEGSLFRGFRLSGGCRFLCSYFG